MFICKVFDGNSRAFKILLSSALEVICVVEIENREYMQNRYMLLQQDNLLPINDEYLKNKIESVVKEHLNRVNLTIKNAFN